MTATALKKPTPWALGLSYGGLIPFVGLASAVWLLDPADRARSIAALLGYGATILSFLGAIHWGFAMRDASAPSTGLLVWGVIPSLVAWAALLVNPTAGLWLVGAALWGCLAVDQMAYPRFGLNAWLPMRQVLTVISSSSCIAGALGVMR